MKKNLVILFSLCGFLAASTADASGILFWKKKKADKVENVSKKIVTFQQKLFKDKAVDSVKGMINIYKCDGKIYFEYPKSLLGRDMLIGSTISSTTDNQFGCVGEKTSEPIHIRFVQVDTTITMRWVPTGVTSSEKNILERIAVSNTPAVINSFPIKGYNVDSTSVVFDVTEYFLSDNKYLPPFSPYSAMEMMGVSVDKDFDKDNSRIGEFAAFEDNITIRSTLNYKVSIKGAVKSMPFTTDLTRSIVLLPSEIMRSRIADPRIGIFYSTEIQYSSQGRGVQTRYYANRWRLEPSDEESYRRGECVEPKKQIVFYVDSAFPDSWKSSVKAGVERWQKAFEKIGFKNAIVAKDFPKDDSTFNADNIKYTCVRYAPSSIGNAMGPSWTDPRSGEILNASVYIYHNIIEVVQAWRFLQTAPADPAIRTRVMSDELLEDCIEYVVAHEVGHCLALMHNMSGSAAVPVDSLRSPSFTQKFGTTHSIMDYARNNYVAQPGDKERGVRLTPPFLGLYDYYAIKWLYTPILDAKTPEGEVATLDGWIKEKGADPIYRYGKQQFGGRYDPSSVEEDLGDDPVLASQYGVKNLKYLLANMNGWVGADDKDFEFRRMIYNEAIYQYIRYMSNVLGNIGGIYINERYDGDPLPSYSVVDKSKQKASLKFLFDQLKDLSWFDSKKTFANYPIMNDIGPDIESAIIDGILSRNGAVARCASKAKSNAYTQREYLDDIAAYIWKPTRLGRSLTTAECKLQMQYVSKLIQGSVSEVPKNAAARGFTSLIEVPETVKQQSRNYFGLLPYSVAGAYNNMPEGGSVGATLGEISGFDFGLKLAIPSEPMNHVYYAELKNILPIVKSRVATGDENTRNHYKLLVYKIEQALK